MIAYCKQKIYKNKNKKKQKTNVNGYYSNTESVDKITEIDIKLNSITSERSYESLHKLAHL